MEPTFLKTLINKLDAREIHFVRLAVSKSSNPFLKRLLNVLSSLGNGWLYMILSALVLSIEGRNARFVLLWTALAAAATFPIYWFVKLKTARVRPFHRDPSLDVGIRTLDKYSFPSGHCMTAAALGLPYGLSFRYAFFPFLVAWLLIAWSRLASGHHYPTDVIGGAVIGAGVTLALMMLLP